MPVNGRSIAIFDLGGVLIDWDPRFLYRKLFPGDEAGMEEFLATVCTHEWNRAQDAGRLFADGTRVLKRRHPDKAALIDAYHARFDEMMAGPIPGSVEILAEMRDRGTPLYALTNFSSETYPLAWARFPFLRWFQGVVVSGDVKVIKPDPQIYEILISRFAIEPQRAVFIDDVAVNIQAAQRLGIQGILFRDPSSLRTELAQIGLLARAARVSKQ